MSENVERFRMDFIIRVISIDEKSGTIEVALVPDPRRYEEKELNGKRGLYDKFDRSFIPWDVLAKSARKMEGLPIYSQPQMIGNVGTYINSRKLFISDRLDGHGNAPTFEDKSEEFVESLNIDKLAFVIISLDIVGSTKLATTIDDQTYLRVISTVLYELSEVIPKFHGHVLKYTGDGLIAYFPEPSFITKNDLAIDCALTLRGLVYEGINPILKERYNTKIDVRIGLDSGEAFVEPIGSPETKQHKDIIGAVVSLAAKIQARARPGEICLGDVTERNLHTMWREHCEVADIGSDWSYQDQAGNPYRVHRYKL